MSPESLDSGLHDLGVTGEAEVVVGAEVEDLAAGPGHAHAGVLLTNDHPLGLPGARLEYLHNGTMIC